MTARFRASTTFRFTFSIAVRQAAEIARIARAEAARRQHLERVCDQLEVALASVDAAERVVTMNPAMQRLLGVAEADAVGRPLSALAPQAGLDRVIASGAAEHDSVERFGGHAVVATRIPLRELGVTRGAVLACHDAMLVERLDQRLRSRHRPRRFEARYSLDGILGDSPAMREVRELARVYAGTDATVLITAESGTGKELFAQGIHAASRRANHPFVAINCPPSPRRSSSRSSSGTRKEPSPARGAAGAPGSSRPRTSARSSSTRSATSRCRSRRASCASSRKGRCSASAAPTRRRSTCG
jgi:transcriptional regulator, propionate catabolism operon regulatory protein